MRTIADEFIEMAEQRAREWYATCCERSQARCTAGAPSLEEMYAAYEALADAGGFNPHSYFYSDEDALADAINEEIVARGTLEECIEKETARMLSCARMQLLILPLSKN